LWEKVEREYETASKAALREGGSGNLPLLQNKYEHCYAVFERCASKLNEDIARMSVPTSPPKTAPPTETFSRGCSLPPCDTEIFDGDYLRWPTFRDLFTAIYVNNSRLTPVEKLFHLNAKTSGEAHAIVAKSPLTNDGFQSAWSALQDRFENKRLLNFPARALIDSGSEGTFISERLANRIKLPFQAVTTRVTGLNQANSGVSQKMCHFQMGTPAKPMLKIDTTAFVLPNLAGNLPTSTIDRNMPLADPSFFQPSQIDLLLGADILPSVLLSGWRPNVCGSLLAQETIFGWILTGPVSSTTSRVSSFTTQISIESEATMETLLTKFWEVEDLPCRLVKETDKLCEDFFVRTTTRSCDGKYIVSLPFKDSEHIDLGHSRSSALAQFLRNETRLKKEPALKDTYDSVIQEYIDLGHMKPVPPNTDKINFYLPHHAVFKPESATTKVRVVFNASSPSSNGNSLNDILYPGPVLQSDLTLQILKWRTVPDNPTARHEARGSARSRSVARWQDRWDRSTKGRWTHRLIPDIKSWISRKHGEVDFYLTQALSGHGCFRSYLKRFGHDTEDHCPECGTGVEENAHHVLFDCHRFHHERQALEEAVGTAISVDNLVSTMLVSPVTWDATAMFVASVLKTLRTMENERRTRAE
ncbi:hypothetical protein KR059_009494, partial [Drosophila kikkawai]